MASRSLTINFTPSGSDAKTYRTQYRVIGTSDYTTAATASGSPIVIAGMTTGVDYEGILSTACASGGNGNDVVFSTYAATSAFTAQNNVTNCNFSNATLSDGSQFVYNQGPFHIANGQSFTATHVTCTGQIQISVSGQFAACQATLTINNTIVQTIGVNAAGSYLFTSMTFSKNTDVIISLGSIN